jgi:taurine dioxygenase
MNRYEDVKIVAAPDLRVDNLELPSGWAVRPIATAAGLEVSGIHLGQSFTDGQIALLRQLLGRFKVLVFRKQDLTPAQHVGFARRFGELEVHPMQKKHPDHPELVTFVSDASRAGGENVWHADTTFYETPSMGSILRCVECPAIGGDTIFANMVMVYDNLPEVIKERIAELTAYHDAALGYQAFAQTPEGQAMMKDKLRPVVHPVVVTHPETGEKLLYVNEAFTTHFANYKLTHGNKWNQDCPTRMHDLFAFLLRQVKTPEFHARISWEKDQVVFWDNRSVQHYAVPDYEEDRVMQRIELAGEAPIPGWQANK